jgi:hypothetical protein
VAQLVTCIRQARGNRASSVDSGEVRDLRAKLREATH